MLRREKLMLSLVIVGTMLIMFVWSYYSNIIDKVIFRYHCGNTDRYVTTFRNDVNTTAPSNKTIILVYTDFFEKKPWPFLHVHKSYSNSCSCNFDGCELTYDQLQFPQSDVVIFHARDMPCSRIMDELQKYKNSKQLWAYFLLENPMVTPKVKNIASYFDISISYHLNSDIRMPYRRHWMKHNVKTTVINYAENKTGQIAWLVSKCSNLRNKLADELELHGIKLNVGGKCSSNYRNRMFCTTREACNHELKKFKFYFAAENSFCPDYISEKYWFNGIDQNLVPIVLGGANYSDPELAIPGSYIEAMSFKNVKALADYVIELDQNDTKYNEYFRWKSNWEMSSYTEGCDPFLCDLCQKLRKGNSFKSKDVLSHINRKTCVPGIKAFESWIARE